MSQELAAARLLLQMLARLDARPRSYVETTEAWRSPRPSHPVWDDTLIDRLVRIETSNASGMSGASVVLTNAGSAVLSASALERA